MWEALAHAVQHNVMAAITAKTAQKRDLGSIGEDTGSIFLFY